MELRKRSEDSGATALGDSIRDHLRRRYNLYESGNQIAEERDGEAEPMSVD